MTACSHTEIRKINGALCQYDVIPPRMYPYIEQNQPLQKIFSSWARRGPQKMPHFDPKMQQLCAKRQIVAFCFDELKLCIRNGLGRI